MRRVHWILFSATCIPGMLGGWAHQADARQTVVNGSVSSGFDIRERNYKQSQRNTSDDGDEQKINISPTIQISSTGIYDTFNFRYSPTANYDFVESDSSLDHSLSLSDQLRLSSRWTLTLSDDYTLSSDPESATATQNTESTSSGSSGTTTDTLSRDQIGRTYWTNNASIRSSYALFEKTNLSGGYTYSVLRNDQGATTNTSTGSDYNEYDKHAFFTNLSHGFNAQWRSSLGLNYTRGLYDDQSSGTSTPSVSSSSTPDLDQYGLSAGIDYVQSAKDFFPFQYNLSQTQYDGDTRRDTQSQEWSIGWDHAFDQQTRFSVGGGPSYAKTQAMDPQWGYNAYLTLSKQYQHASWSLQVDKKYETNNFSGTEDSGLTDTYNASANLTYRYTEDLGLDVFGRYSKQSQIDPQGQYQNALTGYATETRTGDNTYDKDTYETGVGLRYSFARWYTAGVKYSYLISDGQLDTDQYDEHRFMVTISAAKDLWRW